MYWKADCRGGVCLGIAIDEERGLFSGSEAGGQIHGRRSLSNPTFLVCYRNDSGQMLPRERESNKRRLRMQDVSRGTTLLERDFVLGWQIVSCGTLRYAREQAGRTCSTWNECHPMLSSSFATLGCFTWNITWGGRPGWRIVPCGTSLAPQERGGRTVSTWNDCGPSPHAIFLKL